MTDAGAGQSKMVARGEIDLTLHFSPLSLIPIDAGEKITIIAGVHVGCFELFANERIRTIADLKGKTVGVPVLGASPHVFVSTMAAHVGLDPAKDINWVTSPSIPPDGSFSPTERSMRCSAFRRSRRNCARARSATWSSTARSTVPGRSTSAACWRETGLRPQESGRDQARAARDPQGDRLLRQRSGAAAARRVVDRGFTTDYDYALQTLNEVPYNKWREYDPEDTIRFYALAAARSGHDQIEPQQDHRRGHGLALPQRAQARAEELIMRAALTLTLAAIVTLASLLLVLSRDAPQHASLEPPLPKIAPAPEFALTSQDGAPVTLADFRGKVVAVTFIFTMCTATCPVLTPMMSFVQDQLGR